MKNEINTGDIKMKNNSAAGSGGVGVEIHNNSDNSPRLGFAEQVTAVPYIAHESDMARQERSNKRLAIALIISIITLFLSNIGWLVYLSQYEFETTEISSEGGGNANYIGEDGNIYNGSYQG